MPWPPSAAKLLAVRAGRVGEEAGVLRRCGLVAGLASAGKKAKKFMLIAARPSVIAWLSSRKNALPQPGGVNL